MRSKLISLVSFIFIVVSAALPAASQVPEGIPEIKEDEASDYLGTWYLETMCEDGECLNSSDYGLTITLELLTDNTMTISGIDTESDDTYWFMKDGKGYFLNGTDIYDEIVEILFDDQGRFIIDGDGIQMIFSRNKSTKSGESPVVREAEISAFEGEWLLHSLQAETMNMPLSLLEVKGSIYINPDGFVDVQVNDEFQSHIPFTFVNGVISAAIRDVDTKEDVPFSIEYHEADIVVMTFYPETEKTVRIILVQDSDFLNNTI